MLSINELLEIEDNVRENINNNLEEILTRLNREEKLDVFMELIGMNDLMSKETQVTYHNKGKIIVVGQSDVGKDKLIAIAKKLGIDKDRFEFYLNYEDAKNLDFKKTQWSDKYSTILVGQMPHSGKIKGNQGSIISALENQEGFPPVIRMGLSGLKITKTSFRNSLEYIIEKKIVAA